MRILVDGDPLVYRAAWAGQKTHYRVDLSDEEVKDFDYKKDLDEYLATFEEPPKWSKYTTLEPVENVLSTMRAMIRGIQGHFGQDDLEIYLGGADNFREQIAVTRPYKGGRPAKPEHYLACREYLINKWAAEVCDGEEADDAISIQQWGCWRYGEQSCIVTIDKDLNMIPGLHYNFVTKDEFYVEQEDADHFFMCQLLSGDSTDNIVGIPTVGGATAKKIIGDKRGEDAFDLVRTRYQQVYGDEWKAKLLEMGRLLWMRREPDELWSIPYE